MGWLKITLLMLAAGTVAIAGCGDDDEGDNGITPPPGGEDITFPLTVGNEWILSSETSVSGLQATEETITITGTETFASQTYYVLETTFESEPGETAEFWLRQQGQVIYTVPELEAFEPDPDIPIPPGLYDRITQSFPWKFADFDASSGTEWMLAGLDTTLTIDLGPPVGELDAQIELDIRASSQGRESVTANKVSYDDAYKGQVVISTTIIVPPPPAPELFGETFSSTQELWIVDGIGLVKEVNTSDIVLSDSVAVTVSELERYTLN
jgi:hypothetical protein